MANRDLINDMLSKRWSDTDAPNAGTAVSISSNTHLAEGTPSPNSRHHLETLIYSIRNMMGAGALNATVTVSVRHGIVAGTVVAAWNHLIAPSTSANVAMSNLGFASKRGIGLRVTMDTVIASLAQTVSIAGWTED